MHITEAMIVDDIIINDMMEQKGKEEGDDELKHCELTGNSEDTQDATRYFK